MIYAKTAARAAGLATAFAIMLPATAHAAEGGLEIFPDPVKLVILLALFVALRFLLQPLLFQPILSVLDERRTRIEGAREKADELGRRADETLSRYRTAMRETQEESEGTRRSRIEEARDEQRRIAAAARTAAEGEIERARGEIQGSLSTARDGLRASAEELAREAAARILGRTVS